MFSNMIRFAPTRGFLNDAKATPIIYSAYAIKTGSERMPSVGPWWQSGRPVPVVSFCQSHSLPRVRWHVSKRTVWK